MATNEILPFASTNTGTNLLTQAEYAADAQRTTGNQPGIARSKLVNKSLRQASLLAAGLAEFIADYQANNVTDSLTPQNIADYLLAAITTNIPISDSSRRGIIETATSAEVIAGTDGDRAITPAGLNSFPRSFSANGYYKFPGGLIVQWGVFAGGYHAPTLVYPIAFPSVLATIQATADNDNMSIATSPSLSSCNFSQIDCSTGVNSSSGFYYVALGW